MALRRLTALLLLLFFVLGISIVGAQAEPLKVVATYSILGDIVQNIAGDNIELTVLVGPDGDSHVYEPTPQDAIALAEADIIFENGLEFETWLDDLYESSGSTATRIVVSEGIEALAFEEHEHEDDHAHEEVLDLGPWAGEWVTGWSFGVEAMQPAFDAILAAVPELTQENIFNYYETGNQSAFDAFTVEDDQVTIVDASGTATCAYQFGGSETVMAFPTEVWSLFSTDDEACAAYRYLLLMPPHSPEPGSSPHAHFRYGSTSFEALVADDSAWYPSIYPAGTTGEQVSNAWITSARMVGLYIASVQGIEIALTEEEQAAAESSPEADHAHEAEGDGGFMEGTPMVGGRLIVNDYESGGVRIVDLRSNEVIADFDLTAQTTLYQSPSGRYAFAVQTNGNITNLIDSGVSAVPHDDHFHTDFGSPALLGAEVAGTTPIHYTPHHDQIAIFHDGDGAATVFTEDGLFAGEMVTVTTARPHHGVAVPMGNVVLISAPNMEDMDSALPIGVDVMTLEGEILQSFHECPGLHGEAAYSESGVAFGCADGILVVERDGDTFVSRRIANPTDNPDLRVGTLYAVEGAAYLLGNYGQNTVIRVDLVAGTSEIVIEAPARIWRFSFHGEDPTKLVALTIDGNLHVIDIATGTIEGTVQVVDPFLPPAQGRAAARPTFVVNGHMAYVSEPLPGDIRGVNLETLEIAEDRIFVGGKPSSMAVFGMTTEEELYGEHDHDHEGEAHDHEHGEFDPHIWHDPNNAIVMVENIRDALVEADAAHAAEYEANAESYTAELTALDEYIRDQVAAIPEANRILVTSHDTFGYFADEYGFEVLNVLGSVSTDAADPGAGEIAELVAEIQESGVPAIFTENITNPALIEQVANEAGVIVAPTLYTDALGQPGTAGETYLSMLRYNIDTITEALQ